MVKAAAIDSGPSMDNSNTALVLNPSMEGRKEESLEVELFYAAKKTEKDLQQKAR